ncbi:MAG: hypothetical protein V4591_08120 [Bdellovibrionota bacterium]
MRLIILGYLLLSSWAFAAQIKDKPKSSEFPGSVSPFINATPKSLAAQKLSESSYPDEAELYCGTHQCMFGLTRGLIVGGDVEGMLFAPLRRFTDPHWVSGTLTIADVYGGFQILRDVNAKNYMNAQIGYRRISFDDGTNAIVTQGFTTEVHYSQLITPIYLQSLEFAGYFTLGYASLNNISALNVHSQGHGKLNDTASYFYRITQSYPTYRFALPAYVELANWDTKQTGLVMPIHGYLEINPFYIQNNLSFSGNGVSLQKTEQNFGIRFAGIASYESNAEKAKSGRYALKSVVGMDFSTSNSITTSYGNANIDLPKRPFVAPYLELAGSWQF